MANSLHSIQGLAAAALLLQLLTQTLLLLHLHKPALAQPRCAVPEDLAA